MTRMTAVGAAVLTVAAGLGIRAVAAGGVAKYAGDMLYTVLICALVFVAAPRMRPGVAAGTALAVSWAVEFLQLTDLPAELSRHSVAARLVLGSTFNAPDLFWYTVGAVVAWALAVLAARFTGPARFIGFAGRGRFERRPGRSGDVPRNQERAHPGP
ncbi:DUF2809 domain-containing protein [Streptomyces sp. NPDC056061]|uniref:ribosomal maturation YjgA family protein n=1 Tax=Streptomyces sp. NPDC056061 TaxID=3345700 RepID=UPI0035DA3E08